MVKTKIISPALFVNPKTKKLRKGVKKFTITAEVRGKRQVSARTFSSIKKAEKAIFKEGISPKAKNIRIEKIVTKLREGTIVAKVTRRSKPSSRPSKRSGRTRRA